MGSSAEAGSSISRTSGSTASARAMHSRCCWPPERLAPDFLCRLSFTSSHSAASFSERSTSSSSLLAIAEAVQLQPGGNVVVDRHGRKRIGLLKHHANPAPHFDRIGSVAVHIHLADFDRALGAMLRESSRACDSGSARTYSCRSRTAQSPRSHGWPARSCRWTSATGSCHTTHSVHALRFRRPYELLRSLQSSAAGGDAHRRHRAHDHHDQDQRSGPRLLVPIVIGRDGIREDLQRQRRRGLIQFRFQN